MNIVILSGNLVRDPELRFTPKGQSVTEFSIACTKRWVTESGEQKERTGFFGCQIWGKRGEAFAKHHRRGSKALVRGELIQDTWEDKETGKRQSKTRVEVTDWEFVSQREDDANRSSKPAVASEAGREGLGSGLPKPKPLGGSTEQSNAPEEDDVPF